MRVFSAQGVQNTQKCIEEDKNTDILITNTARFWAIRRQRPKIVFLHGSEKVKNIKMFKKLMLENHELVVKYKNTIQRIHL